MKGELHHGIKHNLQLTAKKQPGKFCGYYVQKDKNRMDCNIAWTGQPCNIQYNKCIKCIKCKKCII